MKGSKGSLAEVALAKDKTKQYTFEVEDPAKDGEGKARRHWLMRNKPLVDTLDPAIKTLFDNFRVTVEKTADSPYMGKRSVINGVAGPYVWTTYNEAFQRAQKFGYLY